MQPTETDVLEQHLHLHHPSQQQQQQQQTSEYGRGSIFDWINVKQLVFVFLTCCLGAAFFQSKDRLGYTLSWDLELDTNLYSNGKFPVEHEKLPRPIVTDMDNDGIAEMLVLTYNGHLKLFGLPDGGPFQDRRAHATEEAQIDISGLAGGSRPIAFGTGFLQTYQSMVQVREQVVAVLTSDWTVLCLNHHLKLMWKVKVTGETKESFYIREPTVLVTTVSIHKGDFGSVIVGGRVTKERPPDSSFERKRRGATTSKEEREKTLDTLGHYSTFALEGRGGVVRWKHERGDFEVTPAYSLTESSFYNPKLFMHKNMHHNGEVSWHQYSTVMRKTLPHSWSSPADTYFELAHFKKDKKVQDEQAVAERLVKVSDLAVDHISGLAFGGMRPHSASEHVVDPNVLAIHSDKGVDVLHIYQGRPLCSLQLSTHHSAHADINGDGVIDHVQAVVLNPGEVSTYDDSASCYGMAVPLVSGGRELFKHSICRATHWVETFFSTSRWLPGLNTYGRRRMNHSYSEPLEPVLIESIHHNAPIKLHVTQTAAQQESILYDSIFVLSSGRVTSLGPQGEFNWQVDIDSNWNAATEVIYNRNHQRWRDESYVEFLHNSFKPSAVPFSQQAYGKENHLVVTGWESLSVLSADDGGTLAVFGLPCQPIQPPLVVDYTSDGWNDIIVTCAQRYIGYSMNRQSGLWHSTSIGIFAGVVVVVVLVYTRQRQHSSVWPKPAVD
ncbi:hypothetical protein EMCRGX_G030890 [Ephydatia muelleri]|eukprot:Em0018g1124a